MIMRRKTTSLLLLALSLLLGWGERASAQHFDTFFRDSTLRLDYIFSGDSEHTTIYPEEHHLLTGWAGRRHHLDSLALRGNARLYVRDEASGKVIYCTSFNSLYQEWRLTDEAKRVQRAYENVFLIPYPKAPITVTMELSGAHAEVIATQVQRIDPTDILIHDRTKEPALPHEYLIKSGTAKDCIDLAILAEGYTEAEMPLFLKDARAAVDAIFSYEPFKSYREHFNVVAVRSTSKDSGVAVPREHFWPRTPFSSHFDTFYSERYLTTRRVKAINDALVGIPYEHLIILVNSDVYGGGGITPDIFTPRDSAGINPYYIRLLRSGTFQRFAFNYADQHRAQFQSFGSEKAIQDYLHSQGEQIVYAYARYAQQKGVPQRPGYLQESMPILRRDLIALISDLLGGDKNAFYRTRNEEDPEVKAALDRLTSDNWRPTK